MAQKKIFDLRTGKETWVEGQTESTTTYALGDQITTALKAPSAKCLNLPDAGGSGHLGYRLVVSKNTTIPNQIVESWYAPDLGCLLMRETVQRVTSEGKSYLALSKEAVTVVAGEPDAQLFEIPAWAERSPSGVAQELSRRLGKDIGQNSHGWAEKDKAYYARRPKS